MHSEWASPPMNIAAGGLFGREQVGKQASIALSGGSATVQYSSAVLDVCLEATNWP